MKKILLLSVLMSSYVYAADDCPPAAEVAETQNPNAYKDCDYSNTGLNGALHRSWKKKMEQSDADEPDKKDAAVKMEQAKEEAIQSKNILAKGEFNSAQQLQNLRFGLIQKASTDCPKGFLLESEKYLPSADKAMKLELLYHCL